MSDLLATAKAAAHDLVAGRRLEPRTGMPAAIVACGALLGATAIINALVARRSERQHPASGRFLDVDGVRLHYIEKGTGEPIVLIHGNGVTAEDWIISGVFDLLARSHRVIAFDRPGFGYTSRPRREIWTAEAQAKLLRNAMKHLAIERATVVGHSWGTLVAMNLALAYPAAVSRLVLMSGYYVPTLRLDVPLMSGPALPVLGDIMRYSVSPVLGWLISPLMFKQLFSPGKVTRTFKKDFPLGLALRPSQIRASAAETALMIPEALKTVRRHGELRMPVVIMAGSGDKIVTPKYQSQALARELIGSQFRVFDGEGHMIHHVNPREVAALVKGPTADLEVAA